MVQINVRWQQRKLRDCYVERIQCLDDKSLALVMRDAPDDGQKVLQLLRGHYANQSKPRIITLYTELTSLEKTSQETVMDYLIRAEKAITALRKQFTITCNPKHKQNNICTL